MNAIHIASSASVKMLLQAHRRQADSQRARNNAPFEQCNRNRQKRRHAEASSVAHHHVLLLAFEHIGWQSAKQRVKAVKVVVELAYAFVESRQRRCATVSTKETSQHHSSTYQMHALRASCKRDE